MKAAVCLSGQLRNFKGCYQSLYDNIIQPTKADLFVHAWHFSPKETDSFYLNIGDDITKRFTENGTEEEFLSLYKPKKYKFEEQIEFDKNNLRKHITKSRFYGNKIALNLKSSYELENNFKYDWVMISRFDLMWFSKIIFSGYNNKYFYVSNWNNNGPNNLGPYDKQTHAGSGLLDFWFFSNSNNMNKFAECCKSEFIDNFFNKASGNNIVSGHRVSAAIVDSCGFELRHIKYRGFDHEMYRRWIKPGWRIQ